MVTMLSVIRLLGTIMTLLNLLAENGAAPAYVRNEAGSLGVDLDIVTLAYLSLCDDVGSGDKTGYGGADCESHGDPTDADTREQGCDRDAHDVEHNQRAESEYDD